MFVMLHNMVNMFVCLLSLRTFSVLAEPQTRLRSLTLDSLGSMYSVLFFHVLFFLKINVHLMLYSASRLFSSFCNVPFADITPERS